MEETGMFVYFKCTLRVQLVSLRVKNCINASYVGQLTLPIIILFIMEENIFFSFLIYCINGTNVWSLITIGLSDDMYWFGDICSKFAILKSND